MPKVLIPKPPDQRSRVDRLLDRIRNNRAAAVLIVASVGVAALASLTDSVRKLGEALPSAAGKSVAGEWKSEAAVFRPDIGPEFVRLYLAQPTSDRLVGTIQFGGNRDLAPIAFSLVDGRRSGKTISLTVADGESAPPALAGELAGTELHGIYQHTQRGDVAATFRRVDQATQLVDGHFAIVYRHREFPDHRSACTELLKDLDPPQEYAQSDPPDEYGNVHCAGRNPEGRRNFDQIQNDVQRELVCPAHSRVTLIGGRAPATSTRGCECDGTLPATGGRCAANS